MFQFFSRNKANYRKGQIFPFLIAIICVLVMMMMITVNLGQLGVFKTDTSNAADAAALAGPSVLSSTLLGLGLKSDMMAGRALEALLVIAILAPMWPVGTILAIIIYIVFLVEQFSNLAYAWGDSRMGWTNAKKTAVQYAFNNVGVDEPRPTFENFLLNAYGVSDPDTLSTSTLQAYYDEYVKGETLNTRNYAQSGFSRFLADDKNGYWKQDSFGKLSPSDTSAVEIISGYGWNDASGSSYVDNGNYRDYENWVEVKVIGNTQFVIDLWSFISGIGQCILDYIEDKMDIPWWLSWIVMPFSWIAQTFLFFLVSADAYLFPGGLQFVGDGTESEDTEAQVDNNPLLVDVVRYRRNNDLGLWNFRYGETKASSQGHAFCDRSEGCWITPAGEAEILGCPTNLGEIDARGHLFETELQYAF